MGFVNIYFFLEAQTVDRFFFPFSLAPNSGENRTENTTNNSFLTSSYVLDSSEEAAMRKRRLCVKMSPREDAKTAVCDIQITAKSKTHLVNYTCVG